MRYPEPYRAGSVSRRVPPRRRLHRDRPPDVLPGQVRRLAWSSTSSTSSRSPSSSRTSRYDAAAAPPTSASGSATWACARCWSARSARTSPSTARGWSGTASTATRCTSRETRHTARFVCTNDTAHAQIASFYAGAMSEAREIELKPIVDRVGEPDYVLIGPDDPEGDAAPHRGVPPARLPVRRRPLPAAGVRRRRADPPPDRRRRHPVLQRVRVQPDHPEDRLEPPRRCSPGSAPGSSPSARPASGSTARARSRSSSAAVPEIAKVEPTGVGDAFRAGFLAALTWGLGHERAAQLGCLLAVYVVEQVGTQEYALSRAAFLERCAATYGDEAAADFEPHLRTIRS